MPRRTSLEIAREKAEIARLRREAAVDAALAGRAKALSGSFHNASRTRLRAGPPPRGGSAQAHRDKWSREKLRRECQSVYRNNPVAQAMVECACELLVGDGPQLAVLTADEGFNREAQAMFAAWAERCDASGRYGLADLMAHGVAGWHTEGRRLLVKVDAGAGGVLQEIEDERVGNPEGRPDDETRKAGVEIDPATGRPRRYHIAEWRGDGSATDNVYRAVDARYVIELASPRTMDPQVYAPEPALASVLTELELLDESIESTAIAYRIATLFGVVTSTDDPQAMQASLIAGMGGDGEYTTTPATGDPGEYELQPGLAWHMGANGKAWQVEPKHPTTGVDRYAWMMAQVVAARLGLPIDLTHFVMDGNFAATRSRLAMAWRRLSSSRRRLRWALAQISRWKMEEWITDGQLPEIDGWDRHEWKLAPMPTLDLAAEIKTRRDAIDGGLMDFQTASDELGYGDWPATVRSLAEQHAMLADAGVPIVRQGAPAGTQPGDTTPGGEPQNTGT